MCGTALAGGRRVLAQLHLDRDLLGAAAGDESPEEVPREVGVDRQFLKVELVVKQRLEVVELRVRAGETRERSEELQLVVAASLGREREVPITSQAQLEALERASEAQGDARAVMPPDQNWQTWREGDLREARKVVQEHTGGGLHDLRAAYAKARPEPLTLRVTQRDVTPPPHE